MGLFDNTTGDGEELHQYLERFVKYVQHMSDLAALLDQSLGSFDGSVTVTPQVCKEVGGKLRDSQPLLKNFAKFIVGKSGPVPIVMIYLKYELITPLFCAQETIELSLTHVDAYRASCAEISASSSTKEHFIHSLFQRLQGDIRQFLERSDGFDTRARAEHVRLALSIGNISQEVSPVVDESH